MEKEKVDDWFGELRKLLLSFSDLLKFAAGMNRKLLNQIVLTIDINGWIRWRKLVEKKEEKRRDSKWRIKRRNHDAILSRNSHDGCRWMIQFAQQTYSKIGQ